MHIKQTQFASLEMLSGVYIGFIFVVLKTISY